MVPQILKEVRMVQFINRTKLTAIQDLYTRQCQRRAIKMVNDSSHPRHRLFSLRNASRYTKSGTTGP
jgi:hypothetical protein